MCVCLSAAPSVVATVMYVYILGSYISAVVLPTNMKLLEVVLSIFIYHIW